MESNFNFTNMNQSYIYSVTSNIILHIHRISYSVAMLYFTDEINNPINIPTGITIYTCDFQNMDSRIILPPTPSQKYALCWTDSYEIEFNGEIVLNITNKRTWSITNNSSL